MSWAAIVLLAAAAATGGEETCDLGIEAAPEQVRRLMQDREFAETVEAVNTALEQEGADAEYLGYLRGRALQLSGDYIAAGEAYAALVAEFPEGAWTARAKLARAQCLARTGDYRNAAEVYRSAAERLLSRSRRDELAEIVLEFARARMEPTDSRRTPDWSGAVPFLEKAEELKPGPDLAEEAEFRSAVCSQQLEQWDDAARRWSEFVAAWPDSDRTPEARLLWGETLQNQNQAEQARRVWEDLIANSPEKPPAVEAQFRLAATHGMPTPDSDVALDRGAGVLSRFVDEHPENKSAGAAYLMWAQGLVHRGRYQAAAEVLRQYLDQARYADRPETPAARNLLGRALVLQLDYQGAVAAWREFLAKHPADSAWQEVQQQIVSAEYDRAADAMRRDDLEAARTAFGEFLARYPLDPRSANALLELAGIDQRQERWDAAIAVWRRLVSKYPQSPEASEAQFRLASTLENKLERYEEALEEFRRLDWGPRAGDAAAAVARLTNPQLTLATTRVYRGAETPAVQVSTRNVEKFSIHVYALDLETYFRKMHLGRGVEALDVSLIDPDHVVEIELDDYQPHREIETSVAISLADLSEKLGKPCGAAVVTASTETLEASTLVLQSDLDVIVKSSRDEVFVFAENMPDGRPWEGVRVLVSDGQRVFAEGVTNQDGVFRGEFPDLASAADVRVFAISGPNSASNVVDLSGVGRAAGVAPIACIYTDRGVYLPGSLVHVRAVIRDAENDALIVPADRPYVASVIDPRGRLLDEQRVVPGRFGAAGLHTTLPDSAVPGAYRIVLEDEASGVVFSGEFEVRTYRLEPISIRIETERTVHYRGERLGGKIVVAYEHGSPAADREVRYSLAGGPEQVATTDESGAVSFEFDTREYDENQVLPLAVSVPVEGVSTTRNFYLAVQAFGLTASSTRDVYVVGESFETSVRAVDAEGKPVAESLTAEVFRKVNPFGVEGEELVSRHELTTDADNGVAKLVLTLGESGGHLIRFHGRDRFGNEVVAEHQLTISGDDDAQRLRILADRLDFAVGETAAVNVHWREQPALALVTYQGARVLGYRLVRLVQGDNELEIPLDAALAPNFELDVAVMTNVVADQDEQNDEAPRRFHQSSTPIQVRRELKVSLEVARVDGGQGAPRPGDEVEVLVRTTDAAGNPVAAEASLVAAVRTLADRFGVGPSLAEHFRGVQRITAVRTTTSAEFSYHPATQNVNRNLLAERERAELVEAELERLAEIAESREAASRRELGQAYGGGYGGAGGYPYGVADAPPVDALEVDGRRLLRTGVFDQSAAGEPAAEGAMGDYFAAGRLSRGASQQAGLSDASFEQADRARLTLSADDLMELDADGSQRTWFFNSVNGPQSVEFLERFSRSGEEAVVLYEDGRQVALGFSLLQTEGRFDADKAVALAKNLGAVQAVLMPRDAAREIAFWSPSVVTDEGGEARVRFRLPNDSTTWKLVAKAISADTLAGDAESELTVRKEFFGTLRTAAAFTEGDAAAISAEVHHGDLRGELTAELTVDFGGRSVVVKRSAPAAEGGVTRFSFPVRLELPDESLTEETSVEFTLAASLGDEQDSSHRSATLRPYGETISAVAAGVAETDAAATVEFAEEQSVAAARALSIMLSPYRPRLLVDAFLGSSPSDSRTGFFHASLPSSPVEAAAGEVLAAVALLEATGADGDALDRAAIEARLRSGVAALVAAQSDSGGWSWNGRDDDLTVACRAIWALSAAKRIGFLRQEETLSAAIAQVRNAATQLHAEDHDQHALVAHALAVAGQADFARMNRLNRLRTGLSNAAAAYLAAAFAETERGEMATALLQLLAEREIVEAPLNRQPNDGSFSGRCSPAETRALIVIAGRRARAALPVVSESAEWLLAHPRGADWHPRRASGPAYAALAGWLQAAEQDAERFEVEVLVNGKSMATIELSAESGDVALSPEASLLTGEAERIEFQLVGRGKFAYRCELTGFIAADKLQATTSDWHVGRRYEPGLIEYGGRRIDRGFGVVAGSYNSFVNPLTQLPVGRRGFVVLDFWRQNLPPNVRETEIERLVVREPLPAGVVVLEETISGAFDRYELAPGEIRFFIGGRYRGGQIRFEVLGYAPGDYRTCPTIVADLDRPDRFAVVQPARLETTPGDRESTDEYRLTPDELLAVGRAAKAAGDMDLATSRLTELYDNWNLSPEPLAETARMLFELHRASKRPEQMVRYFEVLKEKQPALELTYEEILDVAAAYQELGEYERGFLVARATLQSAFETESTLGGFLEQQGEFLQSIHVMRRLLAEHPPEPYAAAAEYALTQRVYAKASTAHEDAKLREAKILGVDLIDQAARMLDAFMTTHPADPADDAAAFSLANALLDLERYDEAVARCEEFERRYATSDYLDSYWYIAGYCRFALGEPDQALAMCRKVVDSVVRDPDTGRESASPNRGRALYIMAQVQHSLRHAAEALELYEQVKDQFEDAAEAIAYFARRDLKLPELTTLTPGADCELQLSHRNLAKCEVAAYRIDLLKFGLLRGGLEGVTQINLAGIRPTHQETIALGDGADYADRETTIRLPLRDEGAYLVVARGDEFSTAALVLISPLELEVQEEAELGRVRATVKDAATGEYLPKVACKAIGSESEGFVSGETDLRGVYVADGLVGRAAVIAHGGDGRFAMYRGETYLGAPAPQETSRGRKAGVDLPALSSPQDELLRGLQESNSVMQQGVNGRLDALYGNDTKGVQLEKAF